MNIFYFDKDPYVAAQAQPDKLVVKMPLETAQMLCTAHREVGCTDYAEENNLYKDVKPIRPKPTGVPALTILGDKPKFIIL